MTDAVAKLFDADPSTYVPHSLHSPERAWRESNCYADLWVAVLHALGSEVYASLAYTLDVGFEGDQFTFYKPSLSELDELYGIRVEELCLWGPTLDHCEVQVARRRMPLVEVDAHYLPDTQGIDYRTNHVKTTVGIVALDRPRRTMTYFHNAGLFALEGEDFDGIFDAGGPGRLPPYAEFASFDRLTHRSSGELREIARSQAQKHWARAGDNPLAIYAERVDEQLASCIARGEEDFHHYIFASVRQLGSSADFAAHFLRWLRGESDRLSRAIEGFEKISEISKMLILKTARMAHRGRASSVRANIEEMAASWQAVADELTQEL